MGIRLTAEKMGVDLRILPFFKSVFAISRDGYSYRTIGCDYSKTLADVNVVINRCQSKNRRLNVSSIFESLGKQLINSQRIEYVCFSKLRTLLILASNGVKIPKTVYISPNVSEKITNNGKIDNTGLILNLLESELTEPFVIKPDYGTHGAGVMLVRDSDDFMLKIAEHKPTIANPTGLIAQEFIPKWFFDLRIIVSKNKGSPPRCQPNALARGGFKDFRTNTFLGNMVFRVELPPKVIRVAEISASAIADGQDAWVIGLDAMPCLSHISEQDNLELGRRFDELSSDFVKVNNVKKMPSKKQAFAEYSKLLDEAFCDYCCSDSYLHIQDVINKVLSKSAEDVVIHEGNSCPEFWEQTRAVAGINVAELLLSSALSLIDG